ncbi:S-layer homology domain-containing protein [Pelotomaculum schinkii]|uniref:S-layer homology domain-containing protein n=1 Tax=Pelotomaculum schinkii TaxID=78350 RepID=UPI001FA9921A|nr:S-layer homology domain-containing protein [Pelotomaculum schinkii]
MINLVPVEIADHDQLTISYDGAIQRALFYGVTKLDAEGKFNAKGKISRAEAAEQIYNALEYLKAHPAPAATE